MLNSHGVFWHFEFISGFPYSSLPPQYPVHSLAFWHLESLIWMESAIALVGRGFLSSRDSSLWSLDFPPISSSLALPRTLISWMRRRKLMWWRNFEKPAPQVKTKRQTSLVGAKSERHLCFLKCGCWPLSSSLMVRYLLAIDVYEIKGLNCLGVVLFSLA